MKLVYIAIQLVSMPSLCGGQRPDRTPGKPLSGHNVRRNGFPTAADIIEEQSPGREERVQYCMDESIPHLVYRQTIKKQLIKYKNNYNILKYNKNIIKF